MGDGELLCSCHTSAPLERDLTASILGTTSALYIAPATAPSIACAIIWKTDSAIVKPTDMYVTLKYEAPGISANHRKIS